MLKKSVAICVTNDLVTDQRVHRTSSLLHSNNYNVVLIGRLLNNSKTLDRPYKVLRQKLTFTKGALFYANYNIYLFNTLRKTNPDLVFANDLDTLPAAYLYCKLFKKPIIFDSHEYFPEVPELINRKFIQKIWLTIEASIVPHLTNCCTVSPPIAEIFKEKYKVHFKLVRNLPTKKSVPSASKQVLRKRLGLPENKSIIIYQGALNLGRGIELAIKALPHCSNTHLVIAGDGDIKTELNTLVESLNLNQSVTFTGKLPLEQLFHYTQCADLGFSLEEDLGLNYRYALPNKIFDYVQARIPVVCSNLPVMKEVVEHNKIGMVFTQERTAENLAQVFNTLLHNKSTYTEALENAANKYNWENEQEVLLKMLEEAFTS